MSFTVAIGDELCTCSICFEFYKDPKVLPCLHTFCEACLEKHYASYRAQNYVNGCLSCPTCRELIYVSVKGIGGFRTDVVVKRVRQLMKKLPLDEENYPAGEGASLLSYDPEFVVQIKSELGGKLDQIQRSVGKLRNRLLSIHNNEVQIRMAMAAQAEKKPVLDLKTVANVKKCSIDSDYYKLQWLASEEKDVYMKVIELKSVEGILEEMLHKATPEQINFCHAKLREYVQVISHLLEPACPKRVFQASEDSMRGSSKVKVAKQKENEATGQQKPVSKSKSNGKKSKIQCKLLYKLSGRGTGPGKFNYPTHATFMSNGAFVVSDKNNFRLQLFDKKGQFVKEILSGEVKPRRAKVSPVDGHIYVSDEASQTLSVFTHSGQLVRRIGQELFHCAAGLDFTSKGNAVVTDPDRCYVTLHDTKTDEVLVSFFYRHFSDRVMPHPYYVAVTEEDQLIVSDMRNNRVKVFSDAGKLLFTISDLVCPRGVCVDPQGNILVAEGDKHCISMFSPVGKFIQNILSKDDGLRYPLSLDMNKDGQLLVTQCDHFEPHEVLLFQLG